MTDFDELLSMAKKARESAYAPYSHFAVGAALLCKNGRVYTGCNIENAAYSPSNCAERTAFFTAVASGERDFCAIAVVGARVGESPDAPCPPCGVCRQVMLEFCDPESFVVILSGSDGKPEKHTLSRLMPLSFSNARL